MCALQGYLFHPSKNTNPYNVKKFENKDEGERHIACFPHIIAVEYAELRVIDENEIRKEKNKKRDLNVVTDCRFVYAYVRNDKRCKGLQHLITDGPWYPLKY